MFYKYYGLNKLINLLLKEKPDLILMTFPTPVMSVLTEQFNMRIPIATVMTDYRLQRTGLLQILIDIMWLLKIQKKTL